MHTRTTRIVLAASLLLAGSAFAQGAAGSDPQLRVLSESELTRYIAAMRELTTLGDEVSAGLGSDPSESLSWAAGIAHEGKVKQAIESKGFTPDSFVDVHWNTMMAYVAAEMQGRKAEMEAARKQQQAALEAMKAQLSPEQVEQMMQGMTGMQAMFEAYEAVPPANISLVNKHQQELAAALDH